MNRKPGRRRRLEEIVETMAHFSRVARKPVWFSYDQLWDIHKKSDGYSKTRRMTSNTGFPSRQQFGHFAPTFRSTQGIIRRKRIKVKVFPDLPHSSSNQRNEVRYAFILPNMDAAEGVDYGGVQ